MKKSSPKNLSADSWPTVDRQVFWGALLHNYRGLRVKDFVIFSMNVLGSWLVSTLLTSFPYSAFNYSQLLVVGHKTLNVGVICQGGEGGLEVVGIKGVYSISSSSTCIKTSTGGNFFIFKERFLIFFPLTLTVLIYQRKGGVCLILLLKASGVGVSLTSKPSLENPQPNAIVI